MTGHLSEPILNALVDGELPPDQLLDANRHLTDCLSCTSQALHQSLLKSRVANAGQRYAPSAQFEQRIKRLVSQEGSAPSQPSAIPVTRSRTHAPWRFGALGWAAAALILLASLTVMLVQRTMRQTGTAEADRAALTAEVFDQHVATLAQNLPPQVVSTDRHTVKPWFQGKIPFSFNLPEGLPDDTTLEGANLTYLNSQPVAQLLYNIGRHRVSVFLRQKSGTATAADFVAEHAGFHVMTANTTTLEVIAISDVDPARLAGLLNHLKQAQDVENSPLQ